MSDDDDKTTKIQVPTTALYMLVAALLGGGFATGGGAVFASAGASQASLKDLDRRLTAASAANHSALHAHLTAPTFHGNLASKVDSLAGRQSAVELEQRELRASNLKLVVYVQRICEKLKARCD